MLCTCHKENVKKISTLGLRLLITFTVSFKVWLLETKLSLPFHLCVSVSPFLSTSWCWRKQRLPVHFNVSISVHAVLLAALSAIAFVLSVKMSTQSQGQMTSSCYYRNSFIIKGSLMAYTILSPYCHPTP